MRWNIIGHVELDNGITLHNWLRFVTADSQTEAETEAIRLVTAELVHVRRCWVVASEQQNSAPWLSREYWANRQKSKNL